MKMKKILGLFFIGIFLLSIVLSSSESVKAKMGMLSKSDRYSVSINPIKSADQNRTDLAKK
jgi:hypothetical protein